MRLHGQLNRLLLLRELPRSSAARRLSDPVAFCECRAARSQVPWTHATDDYQPVVNDGPGMRTLRAMALPDQHVHSMGRDFHVVWKPLPFKPALEECTQAYGICFTEEGKIVLATGEPEYWNLLGGTTESGETLEQTLARETMEEAGVELIDCEYIGCQLVEDPQNPEGKTLYYQTRFWGLVRLHEWTPNFETHRRRLVDPDEFLSVLEWGAAPIAAEILRLGLEVHRRRRT